MTRDKFEEQVSVVSALQHSLSRRAYQLVVDRGWLSREDVATELGILRSVAAFHLDKLLGAGLLQTRYERTSGRTGPGAGRTAKMYGCSSAEIDLSLPPRQYDLASNLLADALAKASDNPETATDALGEVARNAGYELGRRAAANRADISARALLLSSLAENGYRPQQRGCDIILSNCPFHSLVGRHPEMVCQMNLDLLTGLINGLDCADQLSPLLEPAERRCCVLLVPA